VGLVEGGEAVAHVDVADGADEGLHGRLADLKGEKLEYFREARGAAVVDQNQPHPPRGQMGVGGRKFG
jgi:hypothetical protein